MSGRFARALAVALLGASFLVAIAPQASATFPGGNGRMVLSTDRDGDFELYSMELEGTDPVDLTNTPSSDEFLPAFSPSGNRIAFATDRDGNFEVYVMNADGSGQTRVTNHTAFDSEPSFCDEDTVVFTSLRDGDPEVFLVNTNGTGLEQLTFNSVFDAQPACSPAGNRIAFVSVSTGNPEIFEMHLDGSDPQNLTENPAADRDPDYAPDGKSLFFASLRDDNFEIFAYTFPSGTAATAQPGGQTTQLTNTPASDGELRLPKATPDGSDINATRQELDAEGTVISESTVRFPAAGGAPVQVVGDGGSDAQAVVQPRVTCDVVSKGNGEFQLRVDGTSGPDDILLREPPGFEGQGLVEIVVNGEVLKVVSNSVIVDGQVVGTITSLVIDAGDGDDQVTISLHVPLLHLPLFDRMVGGSGADRLQVGTLDELRSGEIPNPLNTILFGEAGDDTIIGGGNMDGGAGRDTILSTGDGTTIDGGGSADTIKVGGGATEVDGGRGNDNLEEVEDILSEVEEVIVPAGPAFGQSRAPGDGPGDVVFAGGPGSDRLVALDGDDRLRGGNGADTLRGGGGSDHLDGQEGADALFGQSGNDLLIGGAGGPDACDGGPGRDRILVGGDEGCETFS